MKKNIVLFIADQMRCDALRHMGNTASITPHLDQLAKDGVSFQHAYCQNPVCVPSRCSFLSGLYPHTSGHRTMHYLQRSYEQNIFKEMKDQGYEVIWIGRNDVLMPGQAKDAYCDAYFNGVDDQIHMEDTQKYAYPGCPSEKPSFMQHASIYSFYQGKLDQAKARKTFDWNCVDSALQYLKQRKDSDRPFFLYISVLFPHPPYACEEPWFSSIDRSKLMPRRVNAELLQKPSILKEIRRKQQLSAWTEEQYNELRATYLAMVSRFDTQAGMLCEELKRQQLYDDTTIIVTSDHGDYTGDYGIVEKVQNCFDDPISNVPLIMKPSTDLSCQAGIRKALVELADPPATLAELGGFSLSYPQFGKSLLHLLQEDQQHKDIVLCEGGRLKGEEQAMEKGHAETSPYWPRLSAQEESEIFHTKAIMARTDHYKYVFRLYEQDEFYDMERDPQELSNCISDPVYRQEIEHIRSLLFSRLFETTDTVPFAEDVRLNW